MDSNTLEKFTKEYLRMPMDAYSFAWQGGEPTLMGVDFYRQALKFQRKYHRGGTITNVLQTNGTLLDDEWGELLHKNQFLVGVSIDGPGKIHNYYRQYADGRGTHAEVLRGLNVLKKHNVEFNVLTLISAGNQDHPIEIYRYLRDELGVKYQQYIECVEFSPDRSILPFSVTPGKWGEFLCQIFDEWYAKDTRTVSIRLFDSILSRLVTGVPTICSMNGNCCNYLVVEHNGDIYPCDFQVQPELFLGNIKEHGFSEIRVSPRYQNWGALKDPHSARCSACRFLPLCMGDCPKNRNGAESVLCEDWQIFYAHTIERFEQLASQLLEEQRSVQRNSCNTPAEPASHKHVGRNDLCPCGSGKKYKNCCGR